RPVVPLLPGSHQTLLRAAVERLLAQGERAHAPRALPEALGLARRWIQAAPPAEGGLTRHVLVLTDGASLTDPHLAPEVQELTTAGIQIIGVATEALDPAALAPLGARDGAGS